MNKSIVFGSVCIALLSVSASPLMAQSILNVAAGEHQTDGSYLWVYKVYAREYQDLNYWILGADRPVYDSLVAGSINGASNVSYVEKSGENLLTGIRFNGNIDKDESKVFSFKLDKNYLANPDTKVAFDGSAGLCYTTGPGTLAIPEPGSLALTVLGLGALGFINLRKRRP
jgi:hypothetical protein